MTPNFILSRSRADDDSLPSSNRSSSSSCCGSRSGGGAPTFPREKPQLDPMFANHKWKSLDENELPGRERERKKLPSKDVLEKKKKSKTISKKKSERRQSKRIKPACVLCVRRCSGQLRSSPVSPADALLCAGAVADWLPGWLAAWLTGGRRFTASPVNAPLLPQQQQQAAQHLQEI